MIELHGFPLTSRCVLCIFKVRGWGTASESCSPLIFLFSFQFLLFFVISVLPPPVCYSRCLGALRGPTPLPTVFLVARALGANPGAVQAKLRYSHKEQAAPRDRSDGPTHRCDREASVPLQET